MEYYEEKGWIDSYKIIGVEEAVKKNRNHLDVMMIYDPELPATMNLAVSLSGIENLVIAHPDLVQMLANLGISIKYDLRGVRFQG